jgi:Cu/Ag efflux pump CusA
VASGGEVSLGTLLGCLAVLVIATRSTLLLVSSWRRLERDEQASGQELVARGAQERLTPIVLGALVTALAFAPVIVLGADAGHEIVRPMALVLVGGLATSTLLNLFVVPALYLRFNLGRAFAADELALHERRAFEGADLREATR